MRDIFPEFKFKNYLKELSRPWKLLTLIAALGYYIRGAYLYQCPTWDVPVSIIMSFLTYIFAPWTVDTFYHLLKFRPKRWLLGVLICFGITYLVASGSYELYNLWNIGYWPPPTYWVNLYYSTLMFFAAGMLWRFKGTFKELFIENLRNIKGLFEKSDK